MPPPRMDQCSPPQPDRPTSSPAGPPPAPSPRALPLGRGPANIRTSCGRRSPTRSTISSSTMLQRRRPKQGACRRRSRDAPSGAAPSRRCCSRHLPPCWPRTCTLHSRHRTSWRWPRIQPAQVSRRWRICMVTMWMRQVMPCRSAQRSLHSGPAAGQEAMQAAPACCRLAAPALSSAARQAATWEPPRHATTPRTGRRGDPRCSRPSLAPPTTTATSLAAHPCRCRPTWRATPPPPAATPPPPLNLRLTESLRRASWRRRRHASPPTNSPAVSPMASRGWRGVCRLRPRA
mmetsp:Transcript_4067/g.11790  ORF Transcript_4067/g.11790 Transcript_4067/m.11790 type:complete len:290 (+) Transcript_4067:3709-4578(+)